MARPPVPILDRFWSRVEKTETCWTWTGWLNHSGYGQFGVNNRKTVRAHRFSYETLVGPIPDGLELDHTCRNRACVNPSHLEPVTGEENNRRRAVANGWKPAFAAEAS